MAVPFIYTIDCRSDVTNIMRKFRCPRKLNVHNFFPLLIFFTNTKQNKTKQNKPAATSADTTTVQLESRLYEFT
jgi:hypothetical protein